MVQKLIFNEFGDAWLPIPKEVLEALGWAEGDSIVIDIPMPHPDTIVLYKAPDGVYSVVLRKDADGQV